jgi:hypothetical protein
MKSYSKSKEENKTRIKWNDNNANNDTTERKIHCVSKEILNPPRTCRSNDSLPKISSLKFNITPANFRSEKTSLEARYEILEMIGKGKFGEIRKIKDKINNELRALKIIPKFKFEKPEEFSQEICILQKLVN